MDLKEQYDRLFRYCYVLTNNMTIAEDIVQEAYIRFWQSHSYKDTGKEMAYLYVIARNLCMDELRKKVPCDIDSIGEIPAGSEYEPEHQIERIVLEEALERLPDDLREMVVLRYAIEMSVTDIAKMFGLSRFAVYRRLKEGLRLLKCELGGEEDER